MRDGNGTYSLPKAAFVYDTVISETAVNSDLSDIAAALTQSIAKDGQTVPTANLPMGGYKLTGVGVGSAATDSATLGQIQAQAYIWCGTAGGTADALTLSPSPAITAYAAGQVFRFIAGASPNTGATTVAVSGLTAQGIQNDGSALAADDIDAGKMYEVVYDGTAFQLGSVRLWGMGDVTTDGAQTLTNKTLGTTVYTGIQKWAKGADVASATALTLGDDGNYFDITGTTAITSIATKGVGTVVKLHFGAALTLTHHSTDLILPGAANYTTATGDEFEFTEYATGDWRCTGYTKASGEAVVASGGSTIMVFSDTLAIVSGGETKYYGVAGISTVENTVSVRVPYACIAKKMNADASPAPGGAQTVTYTLRKNEATDTALTCQASASNRASSDIVHTVTLAAGDYISVRAVASATAAPALHKISIELEKI